MYCGHCGEIVKLFPESRTCKCGKSWGHYLEDNSTTVQTRYTLSIGLANPDFNRASEIFMQDRNVFSPALSIRAWINPDTEPDVKYVIDPEAEKVEENESSNPEQ